MKFLKKTILILFSNMTILSVQSQVKNVHIKTMSDSSFVTIKKWPKKGIINIEELSTQNIEKQRKVSNVKFIDAPNKIYWKQTSEALLIFVKGKKPQKKEYTFLVQLEKSKDKSPKKKSKYKGLFSRRPMVVERELPQEWNNLVFGGQFMDRFEPMPVQGNLTYDTWGDKNVLPRYIDNGIEDKEWTYWGGNAMLGNDNKYHLITCRWPEKAPMGHWHYHQSLVVHATSDNVFGPYKVKETLFPGHNPNLMKLKDGRFLIRSGHTFWVASKKEKKPIVLEPIKGLSDYWEEFPLKMNNRERIIREQSPMAFTAREDGSHLMLTRHGDIWLSKTGISPYHRITEERVYPEIEGRFEDPVIWKTNIQYHLITNDWQGRIAHHMRSKDGIHWKLEPGSAYGPGIGKVADGTINEWKKYEVIRIGQDNYGRATYVNFAAIDSQKGEDLGSDNHNSKVLFFPLTKGKLLTVLNNSAINLLTQEIRVKIQAEDNFNPHTDIDFTSLKFGPSEEINFGKGCTLIRTEKLGKDLILVFNGKENQFTSEHFAGKLLGKTTKGKLLFGYSRLPDVTYKQAILSALPPKFTPIKNSIKIAVEVQNFGEVSSQKTPIKVILREGVGSLYVVNGVVPPLKPFEKTTIEMKRMKSTAKFKKGLAYNVSVLLYNPEQKIERINRKIIVIP